MPEFVTKLFTQVWGLIGPYAPYIIGAVLFLVFAVVVLITLLVAASKRRKRRRARAAQAVSSEELQPETKEIATADIPEVEASAEPVAEDLPEAKPEDVETKPKAEESPAAEVKPEKESTEESKPEQPVVQEPVAAPTPPPVQAPRPVPTGPVKFQDFSDLRPTNFETFRADDWEADLEEAGDDEVVHQAGEVEDEPASMYLDLNRQDEYHHQQYNRARGQFHHQLRHCVHYTIEPELGFRPGMTGQPVQDTFPAVFWSDTAMLFDDEAHRRADTIIPELYFHGVRHEGFNPAADELDAHALIAIVNYALWKGKTAWIHTLAFRMLEDEIHVPGLLAVAALSARSAGDQAEADYFLGRSDEHSVYVDACFHAMGRTMADGGDSSAPMRSRLEEVQGDDRLRLDWFAAAVGSDYLRESAVVDELRESASNDEAILNLVRGLFLRGHLFKAMRLLYKNAHLNSEFHRIILQIYFRNGKNNHFLRRLSRLESPLTRGNWYELHYAVLLLGGDETKAEGLFARLSKQRGGDPPPERDQAKFLRHLRAVDSERFDPAAATPVNYGDILAHSFFYVRRGRTLNSAERQKEHVRRILKVFRNNLEDVQDLFRLEILLRSVFWSFMFIRERELVRKFLPYLESMAGRNQALRIFVGLYYGESGRATQAVQYLQKAPRHPLVMHRLADIYTATGDTREAENAYRALLAEYPNEATFWFNYGLLLEKNEKRAEANRAYHRALDINPDLDSARERITALLEMKVG